MELSLDTKIAVLMGGPGSERPISIASGKAVAAALREKGYKCVTEVDIPDYQLILPEGTELAYNLIHGTYGEDGKLQQQLEDLSIPYTGAGVRSSTLCFDKGLTKEAFFAAGVPTPQSEILSLKEGKQPSLPLPYVIKPPKEGSSVGVHIIHSEEEVAPALDDSRKYGDTTLVEQFIKGKELTVTILDGKALPVIHISPQDGFYDINNKYPWLNNKGKTDYICPADLSEEETRRVQAAALAAHKAAGVEIYSRVDVLLREDGEPFVIEINTIPGMTSSSLVPKAAAAVGINFPDLCELIARLSLATPRNS